MKIRIFKFLLDTLCLDRAIIYSIVLKLWQVWSGLFGIYLIGNFYTPDIQGFYYTFASLVALQSFLELGLYLVILNFASHEWAKLHLTAQGTIDGDSHALSRLISLGRFTFKWYASAAFIFMLVAWTIGYWLLSQEKSIGFNWQAPWFFHVLFSSALLWCMPFLSLLEGCGQIEGVAKFKTFQTLFSNLGFWIAIILGFGLWAAPVLSFLAALICIYYLVVTRRRFFKPFFKGANFSKVDWRIEILPIQWRLGIQGVMNYFVFSLFTPVLFHYHGSIIAGRMGMTLQMVSALQSLASIWVTTKAPIFGALVVKKERALLIREWQKATKMALVVMFCGGLALFLGVSLINYMQLDFAVRILSPLEFSLLLLGAFFSLAGQSMSVYFRAHKKEVLTIVGVVSGFIMAILVWQMGMVYGSLGECIAYLIVFSLVTMPMMIFIWKRFNSIN